MRTAAAHAIGAPTIATSKPAPSSESCALAENPARTASTAPAPKIKTGTYRGRISSASNPPPARKPMVSAAPIAPSSDKVGVPTSNPTASIDSSLPESPNCIPSRGDITTRGRPVVSQCAAILPEINAGSG